MSNPELRTPHPAGARLSLVGLLFVLPLGLTACPVETAPRSPDRVADENPGSGGSQAEPGAGAAVLPTPIADRYRDVAERIIAAAMADDGAYQKLAYLTDRIGHRLSGSRSLERAIEWAVATMKAEGHENVRTEKVMVPHWVRGDESAAIVAPVEYPLPVLGLGMSVGTGANAVEAEVVVVESWADLQAKADQVKGRIVLYNVVMPPFDPVAGTHYGDVVQYRGGGASAAAKLGAVAMLMRSVTAHSLRTLHTGAMHYEDGVPKIPAAAVTTEDAAYIARLAASGDAVRVRLQMGAKFLPDAESANVISELAGSELPEEIVVIGCHIDSWDVGQGAHDDGGGCVTMMHALTLLQRLGLRARRTIRVVLFTNEENGLRGAHAYFDAHQHEMDKHVMAMESDIGIFQPLGFHVSDNPVALEQMRDILTLLAPVGANTVRVGHTGADISPMTRNGVPGLGLLPDISRYFDYHHTPADTLDKIDPEHLQKNVAFAAVTAYVIADMADRFGVDPRAAAPAQ